MLVLSRKVGEELIIGDSIRVTITEIGNGRVKVGITAPRDVKVVRSELEALPAVVQSPKPDADADLHKILEARGKSLERFIHTARVRQDAKPLPR